MGAQVVAIGRPVPYGVAVGSSQMRKVYLSSAQRVSATMLLAGVKSVKELSPQYMRSVGSLRKDSFNRKLASAIVKLAPSEFSFKQLEIGDLPLYNQDEDAQQAASVRRLKAEIAAAQSLLFVTPEYNRSMPGVLKNVIDHASRPYGQSAWAGKPPVCWVHRSEPLGSPWRNSICTMISLTWTYQRLAGIHSRQRWFV